MQACVIGHQQIRRRQMCDGVFDCEDLSDECLCFKKNDENVNTFELCRQLFETQIYIVASLSTNGLTSNVTITCPVGSIPCLADIESNKHFVDGNLICDGHNNCSSGVDERFCNQRSRELLKNEKFVKIKICENPTEFRDDNGSLKTACKCDGKIELPNGNDEKNCSMYHYCTKDGETDALQEKIFINWRQKFDGRADCEDISDEWYSNSVYCTGNELPLLKYSRCRDGREKFIASPRYAIRNRFLASVEWAMGIFIVVCNTFVAAVTSKFLISCCLKICTNGSSFVGEIRTKVIHNIMVLNLCICDLCLGLAIMAIVGFDAFGKGHYWKYVQTWQTGALCNVIGSLCILSVQGGTSITFLISSVRLHSVLRPFTPLKIKYVLVSVWLIWTLAIIQVAIPIQSLIRSSEIQFTSAVSLPTFPQVDAIVLERENIEILMEKILVLNSLRGIETSPRKYELRRMKWIELEELMMSINPKFGGWQYFGLYSHSSMCLPPVIISTNDHGWSYCVAVLILDFCQYLFVLIAYVIVIKKMKTKHYPDVKNRTSVTSRGFEESQELQQSVSRRKRSQREKEDIDMHRRIFCLVATNFICWMPLFILTFINAFSPSSGVKNVVTLALSMGMVQANSMINPLLYSKMIRRFVWRFLTWCFEISPRKKTSARS